VSGADLAEGLGLFGVAGGAAALFAWRVTSRRLGHLDALERTLAAALVFIAAVCAIHLGPLLLGILGESAVVVASGLVALAALAIPGGIAGGSDPPRPHAPRSGPLSCAIAIAGAGAVAVAALANLRDYLPRPFTNVDTLTFHLPVAARWIDTGSLWQVVEYLPRQPHGYYPNNGELLLSWALLPFDNDFLVRFVMVPLLALWVVAIVAAAREIGAPPAARVTVAAALASIPIVGISIVPRAMPDVLCYATLTVGLVFLLRHRRSGRTSDLVLAGLGLGLGAGTKWYGVSTVAVVGLVWLAARLVQERAAWRAIALDAGRVAAVGAAGCGAWLVRNLVESGNPAFPVHVAPFGITILDAPPDTIRDQVGFSIAHYAGDPSVLSDLAGEVVDGAGWLVPLAAIVVIVAGAAAGRGWRRETGTVAAIVAGTALLACVYVVTPYTALGLEGAPNLANFNTRYLVPALAGAGLLAAWLAGRWRAGVLVELALGGCILLALSDAYGPLRARALVTALLAIGLAIALTAGVRGGLRRATGARRHALAAAVLLGATAATVAYLARTEDRFNADRYAADDPAFAAIESAAPAGPLRIGLAGAWSLEGITPVWPSFGPRMRNHVDYIGSDEDGFLVPPASRSAFVDLVRRGRYDALVVGRGLTPVDHVREEDWARAAGFLEITRSRRLVLYASAELAARAARKSS
jgi:hypothetical protein